MRWPQSEARFFSAMSFHLFLLPRNTPHFLLGNFKHIKHHSKCSKWVMTRTSSSFQTFLITFGLAPKWALHRWWKTDVFQDEELRFIIAVPIFSISFSASIREFITLVYCCVDFIQWSGYVQTCTDLRKSVQACASLHQSVWTKFIQFIRLNDKTIDMIIICTVLSYSFES